MASTDFRSTLDEAVPTLAGIGGYQMFFSRKFLISAVAIAAIAPIGAATLVRAAGDDTKPAIESANAWLAIVDGADYGRSHEEAASLFKSAVTREAWIAAVSGVRKPLGKVVSRELKSATPATSLPGAPDGRYVVIQFSTTYENKKSAIETVTPMLDKDGKWRVSGYYVE